MLEVLEREIRNLPETQIAQVIEYVRFLKYQAQKQSGDHSEANNPENSRSPRKVGLLEGGLLYMADDFDKTPDCFEGYL